MHIIALLGCLLLSACGGPHASPSEPAPPDPARDTTPTATPADATTRIELAPNYVDRPIPDGIQRVLAGLDVRIDGERVGGLSADGTCHAAALPASRGLADAIGSVVCTSGASRTEIWFTNAPGGAVAHVQHFMLDPDAAPGPVTVDSMMANGEPRTQVLEGITLADDARVEVLPAH